MTNKIMKLLYALAVVCCSCNNAERNTEPMAVLMDTDMGNGVDDVMALQQLLDYEREGRVRLLASGADEYSPLDGKELVKRKVRLLALMGGNYDKEAKRPEWNLRQDIESAHKIFCEWQTPIVASGFEVGAQCVCTKEQIRDAFPQGESHPLYISFCLASKVSHYHGETWDATIVHHVMEPDDDTFTLSPSGYISVNEDGSTLFTPSLEGKHRYLIVSQPCP